MYNNKAVITEPKWKRWVVETTKPIFTPKLCQEIIDLSKTLSQENGTIFEDQNTNNDLGRKSTVSFLPFDKMQPMYNDINNFI